MAYYLTIKKGNLNIPLCIDDFNQFKHISKFKRGSYSLEEIDNFTTSFLNDIELKKELYIHHQIEIIDFDKEISVKFKQKGELKKVKYDLFYADSKKYLDTNYLRYNILAKQNDYEFLKRLAAYYRNSYKNCTVVNRLLTIVQTNNRFHENVHQLLNLFFENEILQWNVKENDYTLKYKSLHDLAAFVRNYDAKLELQEKIEQPKKDSPISNKTAKATATNEETNLSPSEIDTLVRSKKRSKTEIDGQLSLF